MENEESRTPSTLKKIFNWIDAAIVWIRNETPEEILARRVEELRERNAQPMALKHIGAALLIIAVIGMAFGYVLLRFEDDASPDESVVSILKRKLKDKPNSFILNDPRYAVMIDSHPYDSRNIPGKVVADEDIPNGAQR